MERQKIDILNETISYVHENTGRQKVLFLHGFNSSITFANNIIYSKTRNFDVVAFDFPGSGNSSNNNEINAKLFQSITKEFIEKLKLKNIIIVSHSLGSVSALFVNNLPEVLYTILLSPYNYVHVSKNFQNTLSSWLLPKNKEEAAESLDSLVDSPPSKDYKKNILKHAVVFFNLVIQKKSIFKHLVYEEILNSDFKENIVKKLFKKAKNFEIISGDKDKFISFQSLEQIKEELKMPLTKILKCGHAIVFEHGKIIEEKIQKVIDSLDRKAIS